jgi:hypothetical protein
MRRFQWCAFALLPLVAAAVAGQERTLPIPSNVTVDGAPPIPMSLVEAVAPYGQFRQARLVAWHPVERRMVIATTFGNVPQLHHVRFPGGARTQLTFFGDGVAAHPGASTGDSIVFQKDTAGGGEANQLFRYDFATGRIAPLTDGKSRNGVPVVSRGGLIAYDSTLRDGRNRDLYVVSLGDPASARLVAQTEGAWSVLDWSPDEKAILAAESESSSETYLWLVDAATGQKTRVSPLSDRAVRWSAASFAPDDNVC